MSITLDFDLLSYLYFFDFIDKHTQPNQSNCLTGHVPPPPPAPPTTTTTLGRQHTTTTTKRARGDFEDEVVNVKLFL